MQFRTHPQIGMNFGELIVDNFAGGGGASTGIEMALGRSVDIAINHDPIALSMHEVNHPQTRHYCESVWDINPREVTAGRPVGLAWFSPDCRHFSKAKGGAPVSPRVRGLAWVALKWMGTVAPRVVMLENVEEFTTWGPLREDENGELRPCPKQKGRTFNAFINAIRRQGYKVEMEELRACDYGVPTIRKRLFLVARRDSQRIEWPEPTHGRGRLPYLTAADHVIDWSLPCPSIFERPRPLADNTLRRVAEGMRRFVIDHPQPFIVEIANYGGKPRARSIDEPLRTITAHPKGGAFALCMPFIAKHFGGMVGVGANTPFPTITGRGTQNQLVTCTLGGDIDRSHQVHAFLMKYYSEGGQWQDLREPLHTVPTKDRMSLVTVHGALPHITDIGMRMLAPHELFRAQGFPADYIIDRDAHGNKITKTQQVAKCGNSVCPPLAAALVRANMVDLVQEKAA